MNALSVSRLQLQTSRAPQFVDITSQVVSRVQDSGVRNGCVVVFSRHTTAAVKINENEPQLLKDMGAFLERVASRDGYYHHNDPALRNGDAPVDEPPNGHAHCQHLLLPSSETVPIIEGQLALGPWQSIFLVELDCPRLREVVVQVLGA